MLFEKKFKLFSITLIALIFFQKDLQAGVSYSSSSSSSSTSTSTNTTTSVVDGQTRTDSKKDSEQTTTINGKSQTKKKSSRKSVVNGEIVDEKNTEEITDGNGSKEKKDQDRNKKKNGSKKESGEWTGQCTLCPASFYQGKYCESGKIGGEKACAFAKCEGKCL